MALTEDKIKQLDTAFKNRGITPERITQLDTAFAARGITPPTTRPPDVPPSAEIPKKDILSSLGRAAETGLETGKNILGTVFSGVKELGKPLVDITTLGLTEGVKQKTGQVELLSKFLGIKPVEEAAGKVKTGIEEVQQRMLLKEPQGEMLKSFEEEGIRGLGKEALGTTVLAGTELAPFAKGLGIFTKDLKIPEIIEQIATKYPKIASYIKSGLTGAAYGGTFELGVALKNNEDIVNEVWDGVKRGAIIGAAVPAVIDGTAWGLRKIQNAFSGVPEGALLAAYKNPEIISEQIKKAAEDPANKEKILEKAEKSFDELLKRRNKQYVESMEKLSKDDLLKNWTASKEGLVDGLNDTLSNFKYGKIDNNKFIPAKGLPKDIENKMDDVWELVNTWDDTSPLGLNELKQKLDMRIDFDAKDPLNSALKNIRGGIKDYVDSAGKGEVGLINKAYSTASDEINTIRKEIGIGNPNIKLQTKINNLFSIFRPNQSVRKRLIAELGEEVGNDLTNEIIGDMLTQWMSPSETRKLISVGFAGLTGGASFAAQSPRLGAETQKALGRIKGPAVKYGVPLSQNIAAKKDYFKPRTSTSIFTGK